jgi:hypothetical protein
LLLDTKTRWWREEGWRVLAFGREIKEKEGLSSFHHRRHPFLNKSNFCICVNCLSLPLEKIVHHWLRWCCCRLLSESESDRCCRGIKRSKGNLEDGLRGSMRSRGPRRGDNLREK